MRSMRLPRRRTSALLVLRMTYPGILAAFDEHTTHSGRLKFAGMNLSGPVEKGVRKLLVRIVFGTVLSEVVRSGQGIMMMCLTVLTVVWTLVIPLARLKRPLLQLQLVIAISSPGVTRLKWLIMLLILKLGEASD